MVPFNLRPLDQPLPPDLGNRFGLVYPAAAGGDRGPAQQARRGAPADGGDQGLPGGRVSYGVLDAIGRTPTQVEKVLVDLFSSKGSAVVTNVPGPRQPVYMAGTPVSGVLVWAPCSGGISMSVSIFSYAGGVTVGLKVDAGLIPDPEAIVAGFERELAALA